MKKAEHLESCPYRMRSPGTLMKMGILIKHLKMKAGIQTTWIESQKMCLFSPTAITKYCRMAGLNNRNLLSHSSGAMP